jgi:hypothetical protein
MDKEYGAGMSILINCVQEHCEQSLLEHPALWDVESRMLANLTIWAATYDSDGPLHIACCNTLCGCLEVALEEGVLLKIASEEEVAPVVVAGMFVCLNRMVKQAMESGSLAQAADMALFSGTS